ncbi:uncharacterized protein LOC129228471 [Uloborus diversus]|uniref:uncharacterized protein LOC129228471 n=1 Tax=Uloborus diversus TaxID=327109 RepID=UPI002408FB08|nr:uncharacterized protein LOC129228471 [Uloborus diversus]
MPKPGFYAVKVGRKPGVYTTWAECEAQVKGFPNASYKKFLTPELAKEFITLNPSGTRKQTVDSAQDRNIHSLLIRTNRGSYAACTSVITSTSDIIAENPKITYSVNHSKASYYAVHKGRTPGVYRTWTECEAQIKDLKNVSYRKFDNEADAVEYMNTGGIVKASKREIRNLNYENRVVKKRKFNDSEEDKYVLADPDEEVVVFTDGASTENGKKRSRAGIGVYWGPNHPLNTSMRISGRQTNNRAEIWAAIHALRQAKQIGAKKVKLYTDSQFLIHAITDWIKKWMANGWTLTTGEKVVNKDDFIALNSACKDLKVDWVYVKAHARNHGNEEADKLAVAGARKMLDPTTSCNFQALVPDDMADDWDDWDTDDPFLVVNALNSTQEILPLVLPDDTAEKRPFYAVHRGEKTGVYSTWVECEKQIKDFRNPSFRKFDTKEEAEEFVKTGKIPKKELKIPEIADDEYVTVFTDGAASSNGKEGCTAGIGVYWGPGNALNTSMRLPGRQTNNRAEIYAAVHALNQAKRLGIKNVRLYTDSQFVIKGITSWIVTWKAKDWKNASGKTVINKDDFIALDKAREGLNVDWRYVKGHDNNPGNDEADKLAVAGCSKPLSETMILNS